jgi:rod shape-determining protein MreC
MKSESKSNPGKLLVYLMASGLILGLDSVGWLKWAHKSGEGLVVPFTRLGQNVSYGLGGPVRWYKYYKNGTSQIVDLQSRLAEQMTKNVDVAELKGENEFLRQQLNVKTDPNWEMYQAKVLGNGDNIFMVYGGKSTGLTNGMSVIADKSLVGVTDKISDKLVWVKTITHPESKIAGKISGKKTTGMVTDQDNGLVMINILQSADVEVNDVVITEGTDGLIPGLLIGRVTQITGKNSDVYKIAKLAPVLDIAKLDYVVVITGIKNE